MINLRARRIDQSFSLEDGGVQNYLVVELPDGSEIKAPINDEQTDQIIKASVNGSESAGAWSETTVEPARVGDDVVAAAQSVPGVRTAGLQAPSQPNVEHVGVQSDEADAANAQDLFNALNDDTPAEPNEGELINWGSLPNEMLTVTMKAAFKLLGAQPQMTFEDIQQLANNVAENFGPEEWGKVQEQLERKAPVQQQQPRPAIGQVQWADGAPMVPGQNPGRTVPANEKGYPITEGEMDPGEVVVSGGDTDEDGVGQL
jgi:hypothetical protein